MIYDDKALVILFIDPIVDNTKRNLRSWIIFIPRFCLSEWKKMKHNWFQFFFWFSYSERGLVSKEIISMMFSCIESIRINKEHDAEIYDLWIILFSSVWGSMRSWFMCLKFIKYPKRYHIKPIWDLIIYFLLELNDLWWVVFVFVIF